MVPTRLIDQKQLQSRDTTVRIDDNSNPRRRGLHALGRA